MAQRRRLDLEALFSALRHPSAYPHDVGEIEVVQTHSSIVFLAGAFAYKLKKPVNFGFLDYSTPSRRRYFCEREVELNRRLAPDIYLGVVPVGLREGKVRMGDADGIGEVAVKMVRLPEAATYRALALRGALTQQHVRAVARRIGAFHRDGPRDPDLSKHASFSEVERACLDNIDALTAAADLLAMPEVLARLTGRTKESLRRHASLIERRATGAIACHIHGDLRLEHAYDLPDGLRVVDCIEFNDAFRYGDPVVDAAFFAMDLRAHGEWALADTFADAYITATGDREGAALFPLYESYRAAVRAKVDLLQAGPDALARARAKLLLADGLLATASERPCLVLMYGLPGTGKSALARPLARADGFVWLRSDVVRKELVGADPLESRRAGPAAGIYGAHWTERTYAELRARASDHLRHGHRVIVDATFKQDAERLAFIDLARAWHVPITILACETSPTVARERIEHRGPDASDADWSVYCYAATHWDPLSSQAERVVEHIDTTPSLEDVVHAARLALAARGCARARPEEHPGAAAGRRAVREPQAMLR